MKALWMRFQTRAKAVLKNMEGFQRVAQAVRSKSLKDILSALSSGRLYTGFGHKVEYWEKNQSVHLRFLRELFYDGNTE